jgi:hypothetical protein
MKHITLSMLKEILARMKPEEKDKLIQQIFLFDTQTKTIVQWLLGIIDTAGAAQDARNVIDRTIGWGRYGSSLKRLKAKSAITEYLDTTRDVAWTIELMLYYVDRMLWYTNRFAGYRDEYQASRWAVFVKAVKLAQQHDLQTNTKESFEQLITKRYDVSAMRKASMRMRMKYDWIQ